MAPAKKAKFAPSCASTSKEGGCPSLPPLVQQSSPWHPIVAATASFKLESFLAAVEHMIVRPEYLSSTILRADVISDSKTNVCLKGKADFEPHGPADEAGVSYVGRTLKRHIRRRLLRRRVFDWNVEDDCRFYDLVRSDGHSEDFAVLWTPDLCQLKGNPEAVDGRLPHYYPSVACIAFRYVSAIRTAIPNAGVLAPLPNLEDDLSSVQIDVVAESSQPLPHPLPDNHRIYRVAVSLLKNLHTLACGIETGYQKKNFHDILTGKEEVQDLYLKLKGKYKADISMQYSRVTFRWLMNDWKESTDPSKHLWEDVAIAAWLIVVWRSMYYHLDGRPPGGFVDIGCGNGLLVYILKHEGYPGYGLDLRARKSWSLYSQGTDLRCVDLDPPSIVLSAGGPSPSYFPEDSFLIGNHADELTPWIPLFAAVTPGKWTAFLNIPCCPHELSGRFTRTTYKVPLEYLASLPTLPPRENDTLSFSDATSKEKIWKENADRLLQPFYAPTPSVQSQVGRYFAYQLYLAHLSLQCGFLPEREALRMPSTKNFGLLGRKRTWQMANLNKNETALAALEVAERVRSLARSNENLWSARSVEDEGRH